MAYALDRRRWLGPAYEHARLARQIAHLRGAQIPAPRTALLRHMRSRIV